MQSTAGKGERYDRNTTFLDRLDRYLLFHNAFCSVPRFPGTVVCLLKKRGIVMPSAWRFLLYSRVICFHVVANVCIGF